MARISLLILVSVLTLTTSATNLEYDTLKPFQTARFAASSNASVSQISDNALIPRYLSCTGGAHACRAGQCCLYTCCADGSCCGAGELCYNDKQPSKGPTYCCPMYIEKQCDTGCVPMQSECCGDGYYCEYGYKCTSGGCCRWGRTCRGGSSNSGNDDDDDEDDNETTTTSTRTYAPETDYTSSSTSTMESSSVADVENGRDSTSTDWDITSTSSTSTETVEFTSTSSTTSTRSTKVATALAAPNPAGQAGDSAASFNSVGLYTYLIPVLAGVLGFFRL